MVNALAVGIEKELASAAEELTTDGVEAEHLAGGSFDEAYLRAIHLVETLIGAEVEVPLIGNATVAAANRRLAAVEESQGRAHLDKV